MQCFYGAPGGTRTPDLQVRSLPFYPAKLQAHIQCLIMVNIKLNPHILLGKFEGKFLKYLPSKSFVPSIMLKLGTSFVAVHFIQLDYSRLTFLL